MAKNPINRDSLKKLLDTVTPMNPDTAERFVRELIRLGDERRRNAEKLMSEVTAAGRKSAEHFTAAVQQEVAKQLGRVVVRIDSLERQIEHLNRNLEVTRTAVASVASKAVSRTLGSSSSSTKTSNDKKSGSSAKTSTKSATSESSKKTSAKKTSAKKAASKSGSGKKSAKSGAAKKKSGASAASKKASETSTPS